MTPLNPTINRVKVFLKIPKLKKTLIELTLSQAKADSSIALARFVLNSCHLIKQPNSEFLVQSACDCSNLKFGDRETDPLSLGKYWIGLTWGRKAYTYLLN